MSTIGSTFGAQLCAITGSGNVLSELNELASYAIDGKVPGIAVRPQSSEEVAEIVKFARAEKLAVVASGARTKLNIGMPPRQYDIAIDMTKLARVIAYDPSDLTLGVEAGVSLRDIVSLLAEHRQFLPLAAPFANHATVGGTIATGVDGPLRQLYGTPRDYVLGMEFVTGEGVLAKSGGRVVKNVSGYDIHKLMIGALGTLAIVTKVNFRTFPLPESMHAFLAHFKSADDAIELRHRIARSPFTPLMLEILSPGAARILSKTSATETGQRGMPVDGNGPGWTVIAGVAGNEKVLERFHREFEQMAKESTTSGVEYLEEEEARSLLGQIREFVPDVLASSRAATIMKVSVLPGRLKELLAVASRAAGANSLEWAAAARGLGVIYFALLPDDRNERIRENVVQATEQIFVECSRLGGTAAIPWCPPEWKHSLKVWGPQQPIFAQMQKLKRAFDPDNVLSPGRFVGGL